MAFELQKVVPWGRTLDEYCKIFHLEEPELKQSIISFGDGPASFNAEMFEQNNKVVSIDPIYQFNKVVLVNRIEETKASILEQTRANADQFVWTNIKSIEELERIRMGAMSRFIQDFEQGKEQGRYLFHELPQKTKFEDLSFELGLSSHFLVLYSQLGLEFHLQSITEMLRICKEIRIFPLLNLKALPSEVLDGIISYFEKDFDVWIETVDYEFQKGGNRLLKIKHKQQ